MPGGCTLWGWHRQPTSEGFSGMVPLRGKAPMLGGVGCGIKTAFSHSWLQKIPRPPLRGAALARAWAEVGGRLEELDTAGARV